ncbi:hypothetical protein CRG98_048931, partial [Punica granatum]
MSERVATSEELFTKWVDSSGLSGAGAETLSWRSRSFMMESQSRDWRAWWWPSPLPQPMVRLRQGGGSKVRGGRGRLE